MYQVKVKSHYWKSRARYVVLILIKGSFRGPANLGTLNSRLCMNSSLSYI